MLPDGSPNGTRSPSLNESRRIRVSQRVCSDGYDVRSKLGIGRSIRAVFVKNDPLCEAFRMTVTQRHPRQSLIYIAKTMAASLFYINEAWTTNERGKKCYSSCTSSFSFSGDEESGDKTYWTINQSFWWFCFSVCQNDRLRNWKAFFYGLRLKWLWEIFWRISSSEEEL